MSDKPRIITNDPNMFTGETSYVDRKLLAARVGDPGMIKITSAEELLQLAKQSKEMYDFLDRLIRPIMNKERALFAKNLFQKERYTWRALSIRCWTVWNGKWSPPPNQLAGMKICEIAGEILKEEINPPPPTPEELLRSMVTP